MIGPILSIFSRKESVHLTTLIAVMLGGSLGALCRYLLGLGVHRWLKPEYLPTGTMVVNLLGCFLIGLLAALFELKNWGNGWPRIFLFVGFFPTKHKREHVQPCFQIFCARQPPLLLQNQPPKHFSFFVYAASFKFFKVVF